MATTGRKGSLTKGQLSSGLREGPRKRRIRSGFKDVQLVNDDNGSGASETATEVSPRNTSVAALGNTDEVEVGNTGAEHGTEHHRTAALNAAYIPSMLNREKTSFGVFSNLAAHSRPQQDNSDTPTMALSGPQQQLLNAIKSNDLKQATKIVSNNSKMTLNYTDETGETPLNIAVATTESKLVKLVMSTRPDVNTGNRSGGSALHVASSRGLEHIAYMLLQGGADIDLQNKVTGRTALHEATARGHVIMTELLLCCGADHTLLTTDGSTAAELCDGNDVRSAFETTLEMIKSGRMEVTTIGQSTSRFKSAGLLLEPRRILEPTCAICRRRNVSHSNTSVAIGNRESVVSDEFLLRIGNKDVGYQMIVTMPLKSGVASSDEEIVIKSGDGHDIKVTDTWQEHEGFMCRFSTVIQTSLTFVAVSRPKADQLPVGRGASIVTSQSHSNVKIHVGKGSFSKNTNISLQVQEMDEDVDMEEGDIFSSTPFFKIECEDALERSIDVELPEAVQYGSEPSTTLVLTERSSHDDWAANNTVKAAGKGKPSVIFTVSDLPVYAVVLKCKPDYDPASVSTEVRRIFQQLTNPNIDICFLCLAKRDGKENNFNVVLECCKLITLDGRRRHWISKGYTEQQDVELIDKISSLPNQLFDVTFCENILLKDSVKTAVIEFHPKRYNMVQFDVTVGRDESQTGRVYIYPNKDRVSDAELETDDDLLTSIDVRFESQKTERRLSETGNKRTVRGKSATQSNSSVGLKNEDTAKQYPNQGTLEEFLTDDMLVRLVDDMEEDWYKIFVLLGEPFSDIEQALSSGTPIDACKRMLFVDWRDASTARDDAGIPLLLSALFKGGRRDVANTIQIKLRDFYNDRENVNTKLHEWLNKAYQDSNLFVPSDYPKPMSDSYLVLMADEIVPSRELGLVLGLPEPELAGILDSDHVCAAFNTMKMLTLFREAIPSKVDALEKLIGCLGNLNYDKLTNYAVMCAKAWVKRTATRKDDPLRTQVDTLMKKLA